MIIPALYRLTARGLLDLPVIGVHHDDLDTATLREHAHNSAAAAYERVDEEVFDAFADRLAPVIGDVTDAALYEELARRTPEETFAGLRREPAALALSRQALPTLDRSVLGAASGVAKGAYVLAEASSGTPDVILSPPARRWHLRLPPVRNCRPRASAPAS